MSLRSIRIPAKDTQPTNVLLLYQGICYRCKASVIVAALSNKSGGREPGTRERRQVRSNSLLVSWKLNRLSLDILLCLRLTNEIAQGKQHVAQDAKERDDHHNSTNSDIIDRRCRLRR